MHRNNKTNHLFIIVVAILTLSHVNVTLSFFPIQTKNPKYIYYNHQSSMNSNNNDYQLENQQPQKSPKVLPKLQRQTKLNNDVNKEPVLVIGGTGKVGRRVVKQLLAQGVSVRALVRDYDKAIELLEEDDEGSDTNSNDLAYSYAKIKQEEAKLEIIQDNFISNTNTNITNTVLFQSMKGCSTIISCLGTYRKSNIQDFFPPWRILNYNISNWCKSSQHPYYVHYLFTKRLLSCIEQHKLSEQEEENGRKALSKYNDDFEEIPKRKYKIIRISDLNVAYKPYGIVSIITNALQSMIFRYQYLSENLLRNNRIAHYVILRPGDLVEEDRDEESTNLQIDPSGYLPSPSIVGCMDVAKLAVAFATSSRKTKINNKQLHNDYNGDDDRNYTIGIRWCSETLYPQKQGTKNDGCTNATICVHNLKRGIISPKKLIPSYGSTVHYGIWVSAFIYFWFFALLRLFYFMFWKNISSFFRGNFIKSLL